MPGGARRNGVRDVETEPHQQRVMARITAVKQTPSNQNVHCFAEPSGTSVCATAYSVLSSQPCLVIGKVASVLVLDLPSEAPIIIMMVAAMRVSLPKA